MSASIANGRLSVQPFDVKMGDYTTTISGSSGLDQTIDYSMKMMVPAGQLGSQLQGFLNQTNGTNNSTDKIPVTIGVGGTFKDPKTKVIATEQKEQVKQAATKIAEEKAQEATKEILQGAKPEDVVKDLLKMPKPKPDSVPTLAADTTKTKPADPVSDLLENKLQNLLKKKKKN